MDETVNKKLERFFNRYTFQQYKKGEILIRADDDPPGIFYLHEGKVRQYAISKEGDEQTLNIYKPVSFFPMMWAINGTRNPHYFEAMTSVSAWKAPKEDVIAFIKREPDVMYDFLHRLYKGVEGLLTRMEYLLSGNAYAKLITILLISAKRFGVRENNGTRIALKLTEKDIASQTGTSRETISREMQNLKRKRLLTSSDAMLIITDLARLEEELFAY